jgi:hypothetical protein
MEAELVRDAILFVSGRLDTAMGGPELDQEQGFKQCRRSIYFRHAQEKQMEFLKTFDCAAVTECYVRKESIIPQQALAMMNSELAIASARALARRLGEEIGAGSDAEFIVAAYETILSRRPSDAEAAVCSEYLAEQGVSLANNQDEPEKPSDGPGALDQPSSAPRVHARENLVQVLLNHHEFVTIR